MSFWIYHREGGITSDSGKGGDRYGGGRQSPRRRNRNGGRQKQAQEFSAVAADEASAIAADERPGNRSQKPRQEVSNPRGAFPPRNNAAGETGKPPSLAYEKSLSGNRQKNSSQRRNGRHQGLGERGGGGVPRYEKDRGVLYDRPKWTPPKLSTEPIPQSDCPWCGKPIKDMAAAVQDKESGRPVHFDCIIARLAQGEDLEKGDAITYIGGGRFGVVHFGTPQDSKKFIIKKIFEWENKDDRAEWRGTISDHYSVT